MFNGQLLKGPEFFLMSIRIGSINCLTKCFIRLILVVTVLQIKLKILTILSHFMDSFV